MIRFSRQVATSFPSLFIAMVLGVAGCSSPDPIVPTSPSLNATDASSRGADLVTGFGACGFCHSSTGVPTEQLSGGREVATSYGSRVGSNLTPVPWALGRWTESDLRRLFRANLKPDQSEITPGVHRGFEWVSDNDISAIAHYLRGLAPVEREIATGGISVVEASTTGFWDSRPEVKGYVPAIDPAFKTEFGQYLVDTVARCGVCHTRPGGVLTSDDYMAGGEEISFGEESRIAPNITSSTSAGIGSWSESDVRKYLVTGLTPKGRQVDPRFCPIRFYAQAPEAHIEAVVTYLRTIPAIE